jgi:photosystem II stability/assembly factor-like uncharacterized protein
MVLGAGALLLSSCSSSRAAPAAQEGSAGLGPAQPVVLLTLHMVTRRIGWATSLHAILHTADGGHQWTVSRHISGNGPYPGADLVALDGRHVWAAVSNHVIFTADGGRHWRVSGPLMGFVLPRGSNTLGAPGMSFLDRQDGFILRFGGAAAGSAAYSVYRISDGGATWSKIAYNTLELNQTSRGGLPTCDCLGGISFRDRRVGCDNLGGLGGSSYLLTTTDGGSTWRKVQTLLLGGSRRL